ncbi:MAG: proton-conducting membrane transporter [Oscillospiraceae bacterium]|nr:proton-conducting membrane transporter [Oscillospiraceae bacterium]
MNQYWILAAVILPLIGGILVPLLPFKKRGQMIWFIETVVITASVLVWLLITNGKTEVFHLVRFVGDLSISFKIDGMTMVFAGLVAVLWPMATLYAFEYMEHLQHEKTFFMFYTITYGVALGIAFASDILTMYFFYELLTLVTVPLVMHTLTREAIHAVRKYLYYSIGGAAFAMTGMIFIIVHSDNCEFTLGGVLRESAISQYGTMLLWIYLFSFMGFGVKAAIFPFSSWLPQAGVAPTPVTALLHAAAVVNAGAFAIIRLTYYSFGTDFLFGTWVQQVCMAVTMFTIVYGCSRAVKESHLKRRLAWSTVSNLSYIIFGAVIMTPFGLAGALSHFVFHGVMKMCCFLCAGAFIHQTGKEYVYDIDGCGKKLKTVFFCFTVSGMGLMGVPGLAGFVSKWNITKGAVDSQITLAYFGVACLLISALLTAIYMLGIADRAFFPSRDFDTESVADYTDPGWKMRLPLIICAVCTVLFGLFSQPMIEFFNAVASGIY